jgi:hypothetical protein
MVYEVIFRVETPVIVTTQIHLDAILSAVHPAMHNLGGSLTRRSDASEVVNAPLPIDCAKINNTWVWCCTSADYGDAIPFSDKIAKRKNGIDHLYLNSRQTPRTGTGRDRCDTVYGVVCDSVSFLASTTNPKELERICRRVRGIGGLRKIGYGKVGGVAVEETETCWQSCLVQDGKATRNLPAAMVEETCDRLVPTMPPYWLGDHIKPGAAVGDPATLRKGVWLNAYKRN